MQSQWYSHCWCGSRVEAYPSLAHSGRLYSAAWEREHWAWDAALAYLADGIARDGWIVAGRSGSTMSKMYEGAVIRGREQVVQFDEESAEWVISDPSSVGIVRRRLGEFNVASLRRLTIA